MGSGPYAPSPVAFRRSCAALAVRAYKRFAEQNLALAEFISAKGWWIGAPMKWVSWGRRYCGSLHHGGNSPVKGESDPYAPSPVAFRRSRAAPAGRAYKRFAEQNLALAEFISAKGWWIGAPMKRVSWGRRYCGSLHHGGNSPVNGGVARGERCSASTGLPTDSSQVAVGSRDTTQEPPPDAL